MIFTYKLKSVSTKVKTQIYYIKYYRKAGVFSKFFLENISDISLRETNILLLLVLFTIILGIYPSIIIDGLNYTLSTLIYEVGAPLNFCASEGEFLSLFGVFERLPYIGLLAGIYIVLSAGYRSGFFGEVFAMIKRAVMREVKLCKGKYHPGGEGHPAQLDVTLKARPLEVTNKKVRKYRTSSRPEAYSYEPFIRELSNNKPNQLPNIESGFGAPRVKILDFYTFITQTLSVVRRQELLYYKLACVGKFFNITK